MGTELLDAPCAGARFRVAWDVDATPDLQRVVQPLGAGWEFDPDDSPGWVRVSAAELEWRGDPPTSGHPLVATLRIDAHSPDGLGPLPGAIVRYRSDDGPVQAAPIDPPAIIEPVMRIGLPDGAPDGQTRIALLCAADTEIIQVRVDIDGIDGAVTCDRLPAWAPMTVDVVVPRPTNVRITGAFNANGVSIPEALLPPVLHVPDGAETSPAMLAHDISVAPQPAPDAATGETLTLAAVVTAGSDGSPQRRLAADLPPHLVPEDSRWVRTPTGAETTLPPIGAGASVRVELVARVIGSGNGQVVYTPLA